MNIEGGQRDAEKIKSILKTVSGQVITTEGCRIIFPARWALYDLAEVNVEPYFYGLVKIQTLDGNAYAIQNMLSFIHSDPDTIETVKVDDDPYYVLTYHPGSVVIKTTTLLKDNDILSAVYSEFIKRGKVPFYVTYNDLNKVFDTAASHAGRSLGDTADIMAVPISIIARNPKDVTQYYREIINTVDPNTVKPVYVPITSVDQSATSAITKITGSYFYQGVVSAINNPTDQAEVLDLVLRT